MTINNNNIYITKSIYYNNNICNTNIIKDLDISFNYNNIVQYKNFSNLTKKQIYSLFVNNINSNVNRNRNNNFNIIDTNNNFNIKSNKDFTKILNLYNNIYNNPNNPGYPNGIKFQDISQSLYSQKNILEDFPNNDIRKYINVNNYKWFLFPDQKFQNSNMTVKKKYPQLFDGLNTLGYTDINYNLLKKFVNNLKFKNVTKSQVYSYLANRSNKKNQFFGSHINNPFGCAK